jgi:hypothetical protein
MGGRLSLEMSLEMENDEASVVEYDDDDDDNDESSVITKYTYDEIKPIWSSTIMTKNIPIPAVDVGVVDLLLPFAISVLIVHVLLLLYCLLLFLLLAPLSSRRLLFLLVSSSSSFYNPKVQ